MGTRSLIGEPRGDSASFRYAHYDGYPTWMGRQLVAIVQRDGVETARQRLLHDRYGWSSIGTEFGDTLDASYGDGRFVAEAGYGVAYTTEQGQSSPDDWFVPGQDLGWTEWAYVLADAALMVGKVDDTTITWLTMVPYDAREVPWGDIEAKGYGEHVEIVIVPAEQGTLL